MNRGTVPASATPYRGNSSTGSLLVNPSTLTSKFTATFATTSLFTTISTSKTYSSSSLVSATSIIQDTSGSKVGIIVGSIIGGIVLLLVSIGALYFAYRRGRESVLFESNRLGHGELSGTKTVQIIDSGRLNDGPTSMMYDDHEGPGGALRYFDAERVGTAVN